MGSILNDYISKGLGLIDLQNELQRLIYEYNKYTGRYLFVYASDITKGRTRGVDVSLVQDDFYNIQDILREIDKEKFIFILNHQEVAVKQQRKLPNFYEKNLLKLIL